MKLIIMIQTNWLLFLDQHSCGNFKKTAKGHVLPINNVILGKCQGGTGQKLRFHGPLNTLTWMLSRFHSL